MYGKIFASLFEGSMYGAGCDVFAVWAYVIANADAKGFIAINPLRVGNTLGADSARIEAALEYLCRPDPASRNQEESGRRLVREGEFLYRVVSYQRYRDMRNADAKREYDRDYRRQRRVKPLHSDVVATTKTTKGESSQAEAEAEAEPLKTTDAVAPSSARSQAVTDTWNRLTAGKLPRARVTPKRQRTIEARLREPEWFAEFERACAYIITSPFHCGQNDRQWVATLDYLLQPGKATELAEKATQQTTALIATGGQYGTHRPSATHERVSRNLAAIDAAGRKFGWGGITDTHTTDGAALPGAGLERLSRGLHLGLSSAGAPLLPA